MMGRNHLITGTAIAAAAVSWMVELSDGNSGAAHFLDAGLASLLHTVPGWLGGVGVAAPTPEWTVSPVSRLATMVLDWLVPVELISVWGVVYVAAAGALFFVGSLLPDIDSKTSIVGRHLHMPGPHHGITHTDWFLAALFLASFPEQTRALVWLWFGALLHCWMDGLSRAGRVRFYPFGRYRTIALPRGGGDCVVTAGTHQGLYRVGHSSELVLLAGTASVMLVLMF
ncbi:hypothetical protein ANMWB30_24690 [Arthrobacter sp. MWB30]|nr:hypothetical protein ANMWB30_24690 [Arthrobacter sp. MWB30]